MGNKNKKLMPFFDSAHDIKISLRKKQKLGKKKYHSLKPTHTHTHTRIPFKCNRTR